MKIKDFIFWDCQDIKGLKPIRTQNNNRFFLINDSNIHILKDIAEKENLGSKKDFEWMLNRWAVCIVNKPYLLNRFINKDNIKLSNWTKVNVVIK